MRFLWAFTGILIAITLQASASAESIDELIEKEFPISGAPGLAYAVVENGTIEAGARGERLIGSGQKVTPDTPFLIGSISKSITAMAIMKLVEAGKVDLDAEISRYLENFQNRPSSIITVRQLLSHTSGFSTRQGNRSHTDHSEDDEALSRQAQWIADQAPAHKPGTIWDYSNANYIVLGAIIEAMSGRDYADYVETEILDPIGMTNSFVARGGGYDMMAAGHRPWFGTKRAIEDFKTSRAIAPAGGIIASANDMARYLVIVMNGEDDIISAESKSIMLRPASDQSPYYGLGWSIDPRDGTVSHTGVSPGIETLAIMDPAKRKGAVILVNAGSGMGFGETGPLLYGIGAKALGLDYTRDAGSWGRKSLYLIFVLLPLMFAAGSIVAVTRRAGLRAKSGLFGAFSLWFPLITCLGLAWTTINLIPGLFGVSLKTLSHFQPDLALAMLATAVTGVIWALFRLGVYYTGKSGPG